MTRAVEAVGGINLGQGVCDLPTEALVKRGRTGKGAHIQISLFDTIAEYMNVPYLARRYAAEGCP